MEQRVFYGEITPATLASALNAEFNRGNLRTQMFGSGDQVVIIQIASKPNARSGGQTALAVSIKPVPDGVLVQLGQQAWFGIAASLGQTALAALLNPRNLLGRLDDIAQDIESIQLSTTIWQSIERAAKTIGASHQLSEKLRRLSCAYCSTANPVGEASCLACGAPMGASQPITCLSCGFLISRNTKQCPNCKKNT